MDYGTVSCWARNAVDEQSSPCVFRIVAASRPYPLQNCTMANHTPDSLQVNCREGYDGGLLQTFLLEVVVLPSLRLQQNLSVMVSVIYSFLYCHQQCLCFYFQHPPVNFRLQNLKPNTSYRILLFAVNQKGRSEPTVLDNLHIGEHVQYNGKGHLRFL